MNPRKCLRECKKAEYKGKYYFRCNAYNRKFRINAECYHCPKFAPVNTFDEAFKRKIEYKV